MSMSELTADEASVMDYKCKHVSERREPHTCPYAEEINNSDVRCACCEACEGECADDI
jgi:hypothetical protein